MKTSRLPAGVWALGFVSLFMDVSSEMIHGLLPVFLVTVVGASALAVGLIEGVAEGVASLMRIVSGSWSDWMGRRKPLAVAGYGLAAITKPLFPIAESVTTVFVARFVDRVGKGLRGAPRDALVADLTESAQRGAAYGLRQSLDTIGAFVGPLLAIGFMWLFAGDMRTVFWIAVIPAFLSVAILVVAVKEPDRDRREGAAWPRFDRHTLGRLPRAFWLLIAATAPFTLARFSEAFLVLRAQSLHLADTLIPLTLVAMNAAYAASAYPAGRLSDRVPRARLLVYGCAVLIAANLCLGFADRLAWAFLGIVLWGLHMGLTEGLLAALVADYAPADLRGTAFGLLHLVRGVLLLAGSALAGALWTYVGPGATFAAGAMFTVLAIVALQWLPGGVRA